MPCEIFLFKICCVQELSAANHKIRLSRSKHSCWKK